MRASSSCVGRAASASRSTCPRNSSPPRRPNARPAPFLPRSRPVADAPVRLRTVLVDDEAPARALLREYLGAHPEVEIVAECANGFAAVKAIGEVAPDVVFLDVQMPRLDGFEVLELLSPAPAGVFS